MPLSQGSRLGSYVIEASLGAGGMGEVYRARDTKLNRDVAIKVLPDLFASDPDRLARFEREAQAVAALSHPNILAIYDFGTAGRATYAVMELLEGETLRERIARGAQPARRAIEIVVQIARGLAAAHGKGIVHRDLKPENIFLTRDGRVKILDFGLARQAEPAAATAGVTMQATDPGTVLGTVGYMAPEQVRGMHADPRSDIFALGAILYELLSGHRAFARESPAETMSAIAREDPPPLQSPAAAPIPVSVERIVWRCLEKDPTARFQSCHDLAFALETASVDTGTGSGALNRVAVRTGRTRLVPGVLWALGGLIAGAAVALLSPLRGSDAVSTPSLARYDLQLPAGARLGFVGKPLVAVSPDASVVALVAVSHGVARLYVRRTSDAEARPLAGTDGASEPAFSPDGRWIAFTAGGDLKKASLDGNVVTLASAIVTNDSRGLTWTDTNQIVFAPDPIRGLFRIPAEGGAPALLTEPDIDADERTHRWPAHVIGGDAVLYTVGESARPDDYENARIDAVRLGTGERVTVMKGASLARHAGGGHLVFARGGALYIVPFDPRTLKVSGTPTVVEQGIATEVASGAAHFSVAPDGTLVYIYSATNDDQRRLVWADRTGALTPLDLPSAAYGDFTFSPDGTRLAALVGPSGGGDVYIYDLARGGTPTRLTFDGRNATPIWSSDGQQIYYASIEPRRRATVMRKPADGSRDAERLHTLDSRIYLAHVSDEGRLIAQLPDGLGPSSVGSDIVSLRLGSADPPTALVETPVQDYGPAVSPDGRWLAYNSNVNGPPEIFVRSLTGGGHWQVSFTGGQEPHWSPDGRELYYRRGTQLMAVSVELAPTFRPGTSKALFDGVYDVRVETGISFAVDPKTGRLLMVRLAGSDSSLSGPSLRLVLNWPGSIRRPE